MGWLMASLSLTIGRASLSLADLVIADQPVDGLFVSTITDPTFEAVYHRADAEMFSNGRPLLGVTLDVADLPVRIIARSSSWAGVEALKTELADALWQFTYPLTLTVDGVARTWSADASWPAWGELTAGDVDAHLAVAAVTIPLNPA